jgi:TonB family protein
LLSELFKLAFVLLGVSVVKVKSRLVSNQPGYGILPLLIFLVVVVFLAAAPAPAQSADDTAKVEAAAAVQTRIERARALAAAHQLAAAASELESLRATAADDSVRNVASVMLMSIYLEEGNYARAEALLDEKFRSRAGKKDRSIRTYFALAGQAVNGARSHLARYRSFGINVSDAGLPPEALGDLDRLRSLLERMIAQSKEIIRDDSQAYDSLALLEDVLGIRLSLSKDSEDHEKWQREYANAREGLAYSQKQIASLRGLPSLNAPARSSSRKGGVPSSGSNSQIDALGPKGGETDGVQSPKEQQRSDPADSSPTPEGVTAEKENSGDTTLSTGLLNPRATKSVAPSYPQTAKSEGVAGVVKVYVGVNEKGKVTTVFKSEGPVWLRKAAEEAARKWLFSPAFVDGKPAKLTGFIEFNFTP